MAKSKETLASIEKKYTIKIDRLINKMANCSMSELWVGLDKLKEKMRRDLEKAGICCENNGCDLDTQNESGDERHIADNISNGRNGL